MRAELLAILRIARRDALRNKGRSALIALIVALPVLAVTVGAVVARSNSLEPRDLISTRLGPQAQASVTYAGATRVDQGLTGDGWAGIGYLRERSPAEFEQKLHTLVPAGDVVVPQVALVGPTILAGDRVILGDLIELDYPAMGSASPVHLVRGRSPASLTEVAITHELARREKLGIGDRLTVLGSAEPAGNHEYAVVGVVRGLAASQASVYGLPRAFGLADGTRSAPVPDGDLSATYDRTWFVTGPAPVSWSDVGRINRIGGVVLSRSVVADPPAELSDESRPHLDRSDLGIGAVVVLLVLLQVTLLVGPAVAVGARRNEQALAMLAATGGSRRHLRGVIVVGTGLIGLVASVVGALTGVAVAAILVPVMRSHWDYAFPRTDIHWLDVGGLVVIGTLTATAAALLPAWRVGRIDVVLALTGRRSTAPPRLHISALSSVIALAGLLLAWYAAGRGYGFWTALGLAVAEVGLVATAPAIVALAAQIAARATLVPRFAVRDAARQRGRTAPAVAAVLAAVAGGMTAATFFAADDRVSASEYVNQAPLGAVTAYLGDERPGRPAPKPEVVAALLRDSVAVRATTTSRSPIAASVGVEGLCGATGQRSVSAGVLACSDSYPLAFVDEAAADVFAPSHAEAMRTALRAGRIVIFDPRYLYPDGTVDIRVTSNADEDDDSTTSKQRRPAFLVTEAHPHLTALAPMQLATSLKLQTRVDSVIAATTRMPTPEQMSRVDAGLARTGQGARAHWERGYHFEYEVDLCGLPVARPGGGADRHLRRGRSGRR